MNVFFIFKYNKALQKSSIFNDIKCCKQNYFLRVHFKLFVMKFALFLLLFLLIKQNDAAAQQVIPLYKNIIPNSKPYSGKEINSPYENGMHNVSNVSVPTLFVYKPLKPSPLRAAVIIFPGGGYTFLTIDKEGTQFAKALNNWGVTAFVLKYRLPNDSIMNNKSTVPLQDAQQAMLMVREHAAEWNIDASKIGVMGFSAGGHLASSLATGFQTSLIENPNQISLRPDFTILIYPVISFKDSLAHTGSRNALIGANASADTVDYYSTDLHVNASTPKAFIVHASDDDRVPVGNSLAYYEALMKYKIYSELLIYPQGGHGFAMHNKTTTDNWMDHLKNWMASNGWL
jgi:acetyl esterase/lipase